MPFLLKASRTITKSLSPSLSNFTSRGVRTLVVAEHDNSNILSNTLSTVTAAIKIGGDVDILLMGCVGINSTVGVSASSVKGVSKVIVLENKNLTKSVAENLTNAIMSSSCLSNYTHILHPSSNLGKNFIPRLAALNNSSPASDVLEIIDR